MKPFYCTFITVTCSCFLLELRFLEEAKTETPKATDDLGTAIGIHSIKIWEGIDDNWTKSSFHRSAFCEVKKNYSRLSQLWLRNWREIKHLGYSAIWILEVAVSWKHVFVISIIHIYLHFRNSDRGCGNRYWPGNDRGGLWHGVYWWNTWGRRWSSSSAKWPGLDPRGSWGCL